MIYSSTRYSTDSKNCLQHLNLEKWFRFKKEIAARMFLNKIPLPTPKKVLISKTLVIGLDQSLLRQVDLNK